MIELPAQPDRKDGRKSNEERKAGRERIRTLFWKRGKGRVGGKLRGRKGNHF